MKINLKGQTSALLSLLFLVVGIVLYIAGSAGGFFHDLNVLYILLPLLAAAGIIFTILKNDLMGDNELLFFCVSLAVTVLIALVLMFLVHTRTYMAGLMLGGRQFFVSTYAANDPVTPYRCLYLCLAAAGCWLVAMICFIVRAFRPAVRG